MYIKTLSPYYIYTPWRSPLTGVKATSYEIRLYIWAGSKLSQPTEPTYKLTKPNIGNREDTDKVEIARLIDDFINFQPDFTEGLNDGASQKWCKKEIYYNTGNQEDEGVPQLIDTALAIKGYSYGNEGENAQPPTDNFLIHGTEYNVNKDSIVSLPISLSEMSFLGDIVAYSYPDGEINISYPTSNIGSDSKHMIKLFNVDLSPIVTDTYVLVTFNNTTIHLNIRQEYRYDPIDIYFLNKEGQQQSLSFFKERKDSLKIDRKEHENDFQQASAGYHQYKNYSIQGRHSFVAQSGFVPESSNEVFRELCLSQKVYSYDNGIVTPLNVVQTNLEYKSRVNDKLVNYNIKFKYSYNEINNT